MVGNKIGRFIPAIDADLSPEQIEVLQFIAQGHQGRVPLPLDIWSRSSPGLARAMEGLACYLVPESDLTPRETELAILVSAAHWDCAYVWDGHARAAQELGLTDAAVRAIRMGRKPVFETERESIIYRAAVEIQSARQLAKASFEELVNTIGHAGLCDLTGLLGFYGAVAFVLISYNVPGRS